MTTWPVAEAKAKFSELLDTAQQEGALEITRNGKVVGILVSPSEWKRKTQPATNARTTSEFFRNSPLRNSGLKITRDKSSQRDIDL